MGIVAESGRPWWRWYLGATGALVIVTPLLPTHGLRVVMQLLGSTAVIAALVAGIRLNRPRHVLPWRILLGSVIFTVVANVTWPVLRAAGIIGASPAVDLLYYTTYPVLAVALALLPVHGRPGLNFAGYTEAGIITSGAAVVWWTLLVDPLVIDTNHTPEQLHVVVYPMLDMVIFALGLRLLLVGGTASVTYRLIAGATGALLIADTAMFVVSVAGGQPPVVSIVCWLVANALLGAAALHPSMAHTATEPADDLPEDIGTARIYIVTVVATPIMTAIYLLHESWNSRVAPADIIVPVGATALTAALVVARMRQLNVLSRRRAVALQASLDSEARLQQELRERAQHDLLTGLPNRSLLYDRITSALAREIPGALFVLDLDDFKEVNDRFGHAMGDDLLLAVAARLREILGERGLLARLDSDEFAVLLTGVEPEQVEACAHEVLVAMRRPVEVQGHELFATASVGLRRLRPDLLTADILRDAYLALHSAKAAGRDQLATFDRNLREQRRATAATVERLRGAVARDELLVHYQPLVRLADEHLVGVEALIRWQPAGQQMIPPDQFIPSAEDSGLIVPIGAWVLRRSCEVVSEWHRRHGAVVSVNVSPRQLREPDFATQVLDALKASALPPAALILEITEGVLVNSGVVTEQAIRHLTTLREQGVRVAVDDFGTGYSSLAYLRDLPIDHIKIDKSFMPAPGTPDPAARTMVKAIIDLASGLELGTIAEGVETREQVELLRELGCERAQGYYFARPLPEAEAAELLARAGRSAHV
ncbi:EAL domain-containing protein [Actinoplanes friuliensis]|uniref:Protein gmr n=1 Tax=Actinoplanes friuliensis DSM 7358 TaxID=1246995 RepID=U5W378_9ACTN|nr:EAL domain-containing protein [Actinoplanes friuliensis]AGZ43663.1 Protein gmr [Actinoplanes friuliensis DSM 7358]